jgi:hypothetical protein
MKPYPQGCGHIFAVDRVPEERQSLVHENGSILLNFDPENPRSCFLAVFPRPDSPQPKKE